MQRMLCRVLDDVLQLIPIDDYEILVSELKSIQTSASYAAPEVQGAWWFHAAQALNEHLGEPKLDWQIKIAEIFGGTNAET